MRARLDALTTRIETMKDDVKTIEASRQYKTWSDYCKSWDSIKDGGTTEISEEQEALNMVERINNRIMECEKLIGDLNRSEKKIEPLKQTLFYSPSATFGEKELAALVTATEKAIGWLMGPYDIRRPEIMGNTPVVLAPLSGTAIRAIQY